MRLRNGIFCLAFLLLLDVCLLGKLCNLGEAFSEENTSTITQNGEIPPIVALTFDDGPSALYTERLLDGLAERNVKATFFLIGCKIDGNEELIKRMNDEGHIIGNHTYSHLELSKHTLECDCEEIELTNQKIFDITGNMPIYIRPPFGNRNWDLECSIELIPIMWDVDPLDWKVKNKNRIVSHVLRNVKDNNIILMHDIYGTSVDAALEIVDKLQAAGWQFVTVDGLMPD